MMALKALRSIMTFLSGGYFGSEKTEAQAFGFHLEQLEERLLLSASPIDAELFSPLNSSLQDSFNVPEIVVQMDVSATDAEGESDDSMNPIAPILQIELSDNGADSAETAAPISDTESKNEASVELVSGENFALVITANEIELRAIGPVVSVDDGSEIVVSNDYLGIVEEITETLRAAHGPPNGGELDLTIRLGGLETPVIEVFDNNMGSVLADFAADLIDIIVVAGVDGADDTLTVDLSSPFSVAGGIHFAGGDGGYDKLVVVGNSELSVEFVDDGLLCISDGLTLSYSGLEPFVYLEGFGEIVNSGDMRYGNSPAILNTGSFTQDSDATLVIEIGGYTPGPGAPLDNGFDQINVSADASLDGVLQISLISNFAPSLGDTFDFLTFGTLSGTFVEVKGPFGFGDSNLYFEVVEQEDRLQLVVSEIPSGASLNLTTAYTDRMQEAIGGLADETELLLNDLVLGTSDVRNEIIPGTNVTLDEFFGLTDYFDIAATLENYLAPIQEFGSDVEFNIDEFLNYLRTSWLDGLLGGEAYGIDFTSRTYVGDYDWISGVTVEFSGSANYVKRIEAGLSESVDGIGPAYTGVEASIDAGLAPENWSTFNERISCKKPRFEFHS